MSSTAKSAKQIFLEAIENHPPDQWSAYLDEAVGNDPKLRRRVEILLQAHRDEQSLLDSPAVAPPTLDQPVLEHTGTQIGPYKLLQQIGEGGMGTVYMAEQSHPVQRKVALKVIKAGMDSGQVIARFEAERQALALMDHPNIAKVLDAGTTAAGRPYFVMELVKGVPITTYCDENHLPPKARLELFTHVCQAVQHAHQKGIIHRDIKPTNVLVTLYDDKPVPKVIDFGVAKATGGRLTERTMFTGYGQIVGTIEYMSPEQARLNALDVDTRGDIYSLGVLLYELLTGTTPFDKTRLREAAFDEMLRMIREDEPPKPSTRLSDLSRSGEPSRTSGGPGAARLAAPTSSLASIAANRSMEPTKLSGLVRGELDWIVMKALEKDRNRRYETANGFAADVLRYLNDEQVLACPPSAWYRSRKFARRNKAALATAALVAVVLALGTVVSTWQAVRATKAEGLARTRLHDAESARDGEAKQRLLAEQHSTLAEKHATDAEGQRRRAEANFGKARQAVDEYLTQVTENELLIVPGLQPLREDLLKAALKFYAQFTQERADDPALMQELASAHYRLARIQSELGNAAASRAANREAIRLYEQLRAGDDGGQGKTSVALQAGLASAYFFGGRYDDTVKLCRTALHAEPAHAEIRGLLADTYNQLAIADSDKNDVAAALTHHRQAFDLREALVRDFPDKPRYLAQMGGTVNNLGILLSKQGKRGEALAMFERSVDYSEQAYQRAPHSILWGRWLCTGLRNVASNQAALNRPEEALRTYERLVAVSRQRAFDNPAIGALRGELYQAYLDLGNHQKRLGDAAAASRNLRLAREVLEQIPRETPDQLFKLATVYAFLASPLAEQAEPDEADAAERERNADLAVETLKRAVAAGYQNALSLERNKDLDPLRNRDDFQAILAPLQKFAEADRLATANQGDAATQLTSRRQAVDLLKGLTSAQPGEARHRTTLAATLHSIGVLQMGLKQFDEAQKSLDEALQLRQELLQKPADRAQARLDVLNTRAAMGQLYWESGRPQYAHRLWQQILAECRQAAADHAKHATLPSGIAAIEWTIGQKYGEMGLWELAVQPMNQGLKTGQLFDPVWDCRGVHVLAAQGRLEEHGKFCQLLADKWSKNDPANVVLAATTKPESVLEINQLLELAEGVIKSAADPMLKFQAATAWYRAGEYERALELMLASREMVVSRGGSAYLHWFAMVYHKLGQTEETSRYFEQAETKYLRFGERCLQSPEKSAVKDGHGGYWWGWAHDQAMRQAAWHEIHGPGSLRDPWQHLIQARAYRLIGENEKSAAELAAAAAANPSDSQFSAARARLLGQWADLAQATATWDKVVDHAGDNPGPWIGRGRWYAQRGEGLKADADFAKAASLTPNELNPFLEAGWWVGPVCANEDYEKPHPVESDPDPARPVVASDGQTQRPWEHAATREFGYVDVTALGGPGVKYALGYVYSSRERPETLLLGGQGTAKVWLNGVPIGRANSMNSNDFYPLTSLRLPLQTGRNTLLIKLSSGAASGTSPQRSYFYLRFREEDRDRGIAYVDRGLYAEGAELLERGLRGPPSASTHPWRLAVYALRAAGIEGDRYRQLCDRMVARYGDGAILHGAFVISIAGGLTPDGVVPHEQLDQMTQRLLTVNPLSKEWTAIVSAALYRVGRREEARDRLLAGGIGESYQSCWPLLALIHYSLGDADSAARWLQRAREWHDQNLERLAAGTQEPHPHWPEFLVLFREAVLSIEGRPLPDDPRLHLWRARSWMGFGEFEKAETELTAAAELAPKDPHLWLAIARLREAWDQPAAAAEADWAKATEVAGTNALPWIARGRWHAQRGEHEKADVSFVKAASLTPNDLNKFLQAGWWVVGPYPKELKEFCPPELNPDPSQPLHIVNPKTGLSEQPVAWRSIPTGAMGQVDLRAVFNADHCSAYALNLIYSPQERSATLRVAADDGVRLWLNGQLVYEANPAGTWNWSNDSVVPVTLRAGRNLVLAKVSQSAARHFLMLNVAEEPVDRALLLAEWGLWEEAAQHLRQDKAVQQLRQVNHYGLHDSWPALRCAEVLLAAGDVEAYRRHCEWMLQEFAKPGQKSYVEHVAWACALAPDVTPDAARIVQLAEQGLDPKVAWRTRLLGYALYRAGRFDEAIARLSEIAEQGNPNTHLVLAMAHFRRGDTAAAHQWFDKAQDWYDQATREALNASPYKRPHWAWYDFANFQIFYREAQALIKPATDVSDKNAGDKNAVDLLARARAEFARQDPRTTDFDYAVMLAPDQPRHWLDRGRRLAELGRFDEAEADFNKAVELKPDDIDSLLARAGFHAERGEVAKARVEYAAVLRLANAKDYLLHGRVVEREIGLHDAVLDEWQKTQPRALHLWRIRAERQIRLRNWQEAARLLTQCDSHWSHEVYNAALSCLLGDDAGYRQACARFVELRPEGRDSKQDYEQMLVFGLRPAAEQIAELARLTAVHLPDKLPGRRARLHLGIALYRQARYAEALVALQESLHPKNQWQMDAAAWPLLALTHWHLDQHDEARKWLARSAWWMDLASRTGDVPHAVGPHSIHEFEWLAAHVFYFEAKELIDGPESAAQARKLLAKQAQEKRPDARAQAEERRQATLAKAEAAWQQAVELAGDDPAPWVHRGRFYAALGKQEQAAESFAEAIAPKAAKRPPLAAIPFSPDEAARHQRAWAEHLGVPVEFENSLGMKFRLIPPGVFDMGIKPDERQRIVEELKRQGTPDFLVRFHEEEGLVRVFLTAPYYLAQCEVTVQQFRRFVEDTGYQTDGEKNGLGGYAQRNGKWVRDPSHLWKSPGEGWKLHDDQPVVHISWNDVTAFCHWLSQKEDQRCTLPTEAQWEFACRGGSSTLFGAGDDPAVLEETAWTSETRRTAGVQFAQPVGTKKANPFGLHDMLGNAIELCADWYAPGPVGAIPLVDPLNSEATGKRVCRGGTWYQRGLMSRCGYRAGWGTSNTDAASGFRIAIAGDLKSVVRGSAAPQQATPK